MTITTERLELRLLDARELGLWLDKLKMLERELECRYRATPLEGAFAQVVRGQLAATEADRQNAVWHSFFLLIRKSDRVVVGSADFHDKPDENGEVELGYGLGADFEHQGYMTECAAALCAWALSQPEVRAVTAQTDEDGFASMRVLERCGFVRREGGEGVWWELRNGAIRRIMRSELSAALSLIHDAFGTVAKEFSLTADSCPTNGAFMPLSRLERDFDAGEAMYGCFVGENPVGFIQLVKKSEDVCELEKLAVSPQHRHRGIGAALVAYAKARARELGCTALCVGIIQDNERLRLWYEKHGFVSTGTKRFPHLPFTVGFMTADIEKG